MDEQRPSLGRHAAAIVGDFPNAMRFRVRAARDWPVPARYARGDGRPVLIVPGVYETWHYLRAVADALHDAGHPVITVPRLGLNHRPIPASAEIVWRRIRELDLTDLAIVAHSKGGLIGKHVLAHDDVEHRVDRVVAIATPFGGSRMAYYAIPRAMREFRPDSPVISRLVTEQTVNARIVSIAPRWDPHIPDGSTLEGARNVTLPVIGHFRILLRPELPRLVVAEVERELG
ncbi:esterase/lipase family protein [Protaetiibacter intestinalis]|uniref:Alpha/beta hydrolase n=1 Tax=Protaetiibacter intestinalis TaxID=2419774 RepID=A0A387B0C0_9MICO|nr:alpha/beta fold hydrolase [Protaetiibacter intestinalis]AYF96902.1 alpha/beta hydrolase [Protaetiibacter intestinalis]